MCQYDTFCVGSFNDKYPNATCLDCGTLRANQELKPKKAMTVAPYVASFRRNKNKCLKSYIKQQKKNARLQKVGINA
jgi:hypothetical protein